MPHSNPERFSTLLTQLQPGPDPLRRPTPGPRRLRGYPVLEYLEQEHPGLLEEVAREVALAPDPAPLARATLAETMTRLLALVCARRHPRAESLLAPCRTERLWSSKS